MVQVVTLLKREQVFIKVSKFQQAKLETPSVFVYEANCNAFENMI